MIYFTVFIKILNYFFCDLNKLLRTSKNYSSKVRNKLNLTLEGLNETFGLHFITHNTDCSYTHTHTHHTSHTYIIHHFETITFFAPLRI